MPTLVPHQLLNGDFRIPHREIFERLIAVEQKVDNIETTTAGMVAAVGKELWDAQGHGTPDHIDALVTVAGGAAMLGWLLFALSCTLN